MSERRHLVDHPSEDESEAKLLLDVQTYGWHVLKVQGEPEQHSWAFSVGLYHSYGHPEIVVAGLALDLMHAMINIIGHEVKKGAVFQPGKEYPEILENYDCAFVEVAPSWYAGYFGWALWFYRGSSFPVLQCVWPDMERRYPWDQGFPEDLHCRQPVLS